MLIQSNVPPDMIRPKSELIFKRDVKHITCEVCEESVKELYRLANNLRQDYKLGEEEFFDLIENLCDHTMVSGRWSSMYDIVLTEPDHRLILKNQDWYGYCRRECRTISKTCKYIYDDIVEEVALILFKNELTLHRASSRICKKLSKSCPNKRQDLSQIQQISEKYYNKRKYLDEIFQEKSEEDAQIDWLQAMANEQGKKVNFVDPDDWMEEMHEDMTNNIDWMKDEDVPQAQDQDVYQEQDVSEAQHHQEL